MQDRKQENVGANCEQLSVDRVRLEDKSPDPKHFYFHSSQLLKFNFILGPLQEVMVCVCVCVSKVSTPELAIISPGLQVLTTHVHVFILPYGNVYLSTSYSCILQETFILYLL